MNKLVIEIVKTNNRMKGVILSGNFNVEKVSLSTIGITPGMSKTFDVEQCISGNKECIYINVDTYEEYFKNYQNKYILMSW